MNNNWKYIWVTIENDRERGRLELVGGLSSFEKPRCASLCTIHLFHLCFEYKIGKQSIDIICIVPTHEVRCSRMFWLETEKGRAKKSRRSQIEAGQRTIPIFDSKGGECRYGIDKMPAKACWSHLSESRNSKRGRRGSGIQKRHTNKQDDLLLSLSSLFYYYHHSLFSRFGSHSLLKLQTLVSLGFSIGAPLSPTVSISNQPSQLGQTLSLQTNKHSNPSHLSFQHLISITIITIKPQLQLNGRTHCCNHLSSSCFKSTVRRSDSLCLHS